ncbi:LysR family transcriptional regulator [Baekduia alba]|uniref:LysR family transcriptional regulator n=1 Tax=Baekduia alba TaxID=2997333 RepID=UPI00234085B4|nr:LysR family transcriptional regulator [Baekduia alba]
MKLDPRRLEVFLAVVEGGSMTDAARELRFSPAAVSQHVSALERQVGAPLLVRHARGVRPTAAGALLARHAAELSGRLRDAERELTDLLRSAGGTVRLGIFASATVGALPAALRHFGAAHPSVSVMVDEREVDVGADLVRRGALDLAIVFDDPAHPTLDRTGLDLAPLGTDPMDVALPEAHPQAGADPVALSALAGERWILASGAACAALVRRRCVEVGFTPDVALTTDDHAAARSLAAAGMGVAVLPRLMGQRDGDGAVIRALDPAPGRAVAVAVAADGSTLPAALALRDAFVATTSLSGSGDPASRARARPRRVAARARSPR